MSNIERYQNSNSHTIHLAPTKMIMFFILLLSMGIVAPQKLFAAGFFGETAPQQNNVTFTEDAGHAYIEALEFCLQQVGFPARFTSGDKNEMLRKIQQGFSYLPLEVKSELAQSRETWTHYQNLWPRLHIDEKRAFAFNVLAFAYGQEAANNALGINTDAPQSQQTSSNRNSTYTNGNYTSNNFSVVSSGNCTYASIPGLSIASSGCD